MPWSLLDSTSVTFADGNAGHAVAWPGGAPANGDLLILSVNSITTVSTPAGWSVVDSDVNQQGAYMWYRVASGEAGTVTVTTNGDNPADATLLRYSGQDAVPLDVHAVARATFDARTFSPPVGPLALAGAGELVVMAVGGSNNSGGAGAAPVPSAGYSTVGDTGMVGSGTTAVQQYVIARTDGSGSQSPSVSWSGGTFEHRTAIVAAFLPSAGTTVAVAQVTESDAAQPVGAAKAAAVQLAAETDTAQPLTGRKTAAVGQAVVASAAQPVGAAKAAGAGQVVETSAAQPVTPRKVAAVGQAVETDSAFRLGLTGGVLLVRTAVFRGDGSRLRDQDRPGPFRA